MPRLNGHDKSALPRGIKTGKADYGICGNWLGVNKRIMIDSVEHHFFILPGEEKSHTILVPKWCREEVFKMLNSTFSWSNHAAQRAIVESISTSAKYMLWNHGIITPKTSHAQIVGLIETHAKRLPKLPGVSAVVEQPTKEVTTHFHL